MLDPIYFQSDLRVELQQLGAPSAEFLGAHGVKKDGDTHPAEDLEKVHAQYGWVGPLIHPGMSDWLFDRSDDYCSTVFWYQKLTGTPSCPASSSLDRGAWCAFNYQNETF